MIHRNGKVFISHASEDEDKSAALVAKLQAKELNCWSAISPEDSDTQLSEATQKQISGRDVFLRICTTASARSARMQLESWVFGAIQAQDTANGSPNQHIRVDLVMDPSYAPDPAHQAYLTIDTTRTPMSDWLVVLYKEMGGMQATPALSRRSTTIIVAICVSVALLLLIAALSFFILFAGTGLFGV